MQDKALEAKHEPAGHHGVVDASLHGFGLILAAREEGRMIKMAKISGEDDSVLPQPVGANGMPSNFDINLAYVDIPRTTSTSSSA